jgi:Zn-dependent peptidase ImmA (M78 family)
MPPASWQLVIINDMLMDKNKLNLEEKQIVIAHELAHVYLKHDTDTIDRDMEQEADDLIESWGFRPAYINLLDQKKKEKTNKKKN